MIQPCTCPHRQPIFSHPEFDSVCAEELIKPIKVNDIINRSAYCTNIPKGFLQNDPEDTITIDEILRPISNTHGVYHLWHTPGERCPLHQVWAVEGAYVGKGLGSNRAKVHIRDKYPDNSQILISFYQCSNRIAKYLEQLFLDTYCFDLNGAENNKNGPPLYACWSDSRYEYGTETARLADYFARRNPNL